jgi:hypothetical protein
MAFENGRRNLRRPRASALSIPFPEKQRRRLEALMRSNGWDLESYVANLVVAAMDSLEGEKKHWCDAEHLGYDPKKDVCVNP